MRQLAIALLLLALAAPAAAERSKSFGDYEIHYNAIPSSLLQPEVARQYGIVRSRNRGLLTVSVLKEGATVPARIQAEAVNLNDQLKEIAPREIREGGAVYYIATVGISDGEKLEFRLAVTPRGQAETFRFNFQQRFYSE